MITDFLGKLLALLPITSGAAGLVLVRESFTDTRDSDGSAPWAVPLGLFGALVTIGLFLYRLRQIQECLTLREQAGRLEDKLNMPAGCGQFRDGVCGHLRGFVSVEMASWLIYCDVIAAWLFLAGVRLGW